MTTGEYKNYWWFEDGTRDLSDLLDHVPALINGRCVAVAAFDGGPIIPSQAELEAGWLQVGKVVYIPTPQSVDGLPLHNNDEWYILDRCHDIGPVELLVNSCGFGLSDPSARSETRDPTWDAVGWSMYCEAERARQETLWWQIERIEPVSYVLNGDLLVIATRDRNVVAAIQRWFA